MKTMTVTMTEKGFQNLHKFLGRAELKGHEVADFVQLLQELRPAEEPPVMNGGASPSPSR